MAPVINRGSDHIDWMQQVTAEFMWRCCSAAPRQPVSDLDVDQLIKSCSLLQRKDKPLLLKNSERKGKRNGWKPEEGKVEGHSTDDDAERQRGQRDTSVSNSSPSTCQLLLTTAQTVEIWTDLIWSELIWSHLIWSDLIWSDLIWSDLIKFNSAVFIQTYTKVLLKHLQTQHIKHHSVCIFTPKKIQVQLHIGLNQWSVHQLLLCRSVVYM